MPELSLKGPIVQVAIDTLTVDEALRVAEAAVKAGADVLEAGTPLITFEGTRAIGAIAKAFPQMPVLADFKMMDGVRKYFLETAKQGGHIATICAVASDASIRTAVQAGAEADVMVLCDLYASADPVRRAAEVVAMGVDAVYLHWGADQRAEDPQGDPYRGLAELLQAVSVPVGAATWDADGGEKVFGMGADIAVIGAPLINAPDPEAALRDYVKRAREAWAKRQ